MTNYASNSSWSCIGGVVGYTGATAKILYIVAFDKILTTTEQSDLHASLGASGQFALLQAQAQTASLTTILDSAVFSGSATVTGAPPTATLIATTAAAVFSGSASVVPPTPTLILPTLKNNTGTVLANEIGAIAHVYATTGEHVVTKTAQTTNASGVMTITDAALTAATQYRVVVVLASGAEGMDKVTAA